MPLFLALAGFFAGHQTCSIGYNYCFKRFSRLLPPYLLWTIIYVYLNDPVALVSPISMARHLLLGTGIGGIGYFVLVLSQYIVLTPALLKIKPHWRHVSLIAVVSIGSLAITYMLRIRCPNSEYTQFPRLFLPFVVWYPFYHVGIYAAQVKSEGHILWLSRGKTWLTLYVTFTALSIVESLYLANHGYFRFAVSQVKVFSFLQSIALFMLILSHTGNSPAIRRLSTLQWIGRQSYPIYLTHLLFLAYSEAIFQTIPSIYNCQPAFIIVNILMTLGACIIFIRCLLLALPNIIRALFLGS